MSKKKKYAGISILAVGLLVSATVISLYIQTVGADPAVPYGDDYTEWIGSVTVTLNATDNSSGIDYTKIEVWYAIDPRHQFTLLSAETDYSEPVTFSTQGVYQVHYYSADMLGNVEDVKRESFLIWNSDQNPPNTEITLDGTPR